MGLQLASLVLLIAPISGLGQSKLGIENYHYLGQPGAAWAVPVVHFETRSNWYAEMRYNYEEAQTLSLYGGRTLSTGNALRFTVTPMAGFSTGRFEGASLATNASLEWDSFYGLTQSQYSWGLRPGMTNFFFSWSELGVNLTRNFFTGLSMQYTRKEGLNSIEPGVMAGIHIKRFSFPFYVFSPFRNGTYSVLGINYEYNWVKK